MDQDGLPRDAVGIAIEYCLWAVEQGLTPADLLATFGDEWADVEAVHWQTAIEVIARAWRRL